MGCLGGIRVSKTNKTLIKILQISRFFISFMKKIKDSLFFTRKLIDVIQLGKSINVCYRKIENRMKIIHSSSTPARISQRNIVSYVCGKCEKQEFLIFKQLICCFSSFIRRFAMLYTLASWLAWLLHGAALMGTRTNDEDEPHPSSWLYIVLVVVI